MQNTNVTWNPISKGLHWLIALLILSAWGSVELHEFYQKGDPMREWWKALHFSIGLTILVLVVIRLYWRSTHPRPQIIGAAWQNKLSSLAQFLLYLLILAMPLTGLSMRQFAGKPTEFFGLFSLPQLVEKNIDIAKQLAFVHKELLWNTLLVILALHICGALWHHFINKDATLTRMLPGRNS